MNHDHAGRTAPGSPLRGDSGSRSAAGVDLGTHRLVRSNFLGCCAAVLAAGLFAACGSSQTPAAEPAAQAYELVLLERPDSVEGYVAIQRAVYDLCATSQQIKQGPVKPFPALPATLGTDRITYLVRGRDIVVQHEHLEVLDVSKMDAEHACEVDVTTEKRPSVDMEVGPTHTSIDTDAAGHRNVQTEDVTDLRRANGTSVTSTARYTDSRTQNGIELRCLPQSSPVIIAGALQESCVYAREGVLVWSDGKPIVLASRVKPSPAAKYVMVTEPESLRSINRDDSRFNAATFAR